MEKRKGWNRIIAWFLLCSCVVTCTQFIPEKIAAAEKVAQSSELVVKDQGYLYYKKGTVGSDYKLVSQKVGTTKTTTLTTKEIKNFYVQNKYVYYVVKDSKTSKNSIYRVGRDGKNTKCLVTVNKGEIIGIVGDYVYYSYYKNYDKMIIARIQVAAKKGSNKILSTTSTNYYNFKPVIANNRIYYTNNKRTIIYSMTLGGKTTEKLISGTSVDSLTVGKDGLYYLCNKNTGTIKSCTTDVMKVSFKGKVTKLDSFNQKKVSDYRVKAGKEAANDYTSFTVKLHQVTTDNVYYSLSDDQYISYLFKASTDGSSVKRIMDEKTYESYDGYVLGMGSYLSATNYKLFSYCNGEDSAHYYYKDASGTYVLTIAPSNIKIVDGTAYYQVIQSKKAVFKNATIEKLLKK
ncbi:DUF5050 domain-containing protein [Anaerosporobacter sp.]|uniref:DUF5050 domain-containing protein n=1 Tax=Anaerosporobacter sp. TaxID=1872529 RepID=UPI00286F30DC|nr:DUF5050 domain-containing protein [Anaerosporobacter sp.]